jgi:hypothetical protein
MSFKVKSAASDALFGEDPKILRPLSTLVGRFCTTNSEVREHLYNCNIAGMEERFIDIKNNYNGSQMMYEVAGPHRELKELKRCCKELLFSELSVR